MTYEGKKLIEPTSSTIILRLDDLQQGRKGITAEYGGTLAQAASVCLLDQMHRSPTEMKVSGRFSVTAVLEWNSPTQQALRTWNDDEYTTEQGAYGVAILLVEECGLEVIERAKKKTGIDYWLGEKGENSMLFQKTSRLEVSGIRKGSYSKLEQRVQIKKNQTKPTDGTIPAVIVVVEFSGPLAKMVEKDARD